MNKQNKRMYRLISILIIIITLLFNIQKANADDSDNSCIDIGSFGDSVKRYTATLGFYNIVNNGFSMTDPSAEGSPATDSNGNVTTRCKVPTSDVTFIYNTSICNSGVKSFKVGDSENVCGAWFRAVQENDKICVQVLLTYGYVDIGCKYTISPASTSSACAENSTVPAKSCIGSLPNSKSLIPITGLVVSCVKDSIDSLFNNPTNIDCNGNLKNNLFNNVQNGVRNIVKLLLTLYVIFFGIKIALGQDLPKKGEVFIFIMKMILVMYFSVGIPISNKSGNVVYENGISANTTNPTGFESILSKGFGAIGESLSNIIIGAANKSNGLCYYNPANYSSGYSYLSLWDSLDCRVGNYLGIYNPSNAAGVAEEIMVASIAIFSWPLALIFGGQILMAIIVSVFAVFMLSFTVFLVNLYLVSIVVVAIMLYFAPIFVPMALFKATKQYFDSWLKIAFGYALQPVIITAFLALLFTIFDQMFYEKCQFDQMGDSNKPYFLLSANSSSYTNSSDLVTCQNSVGYKFATVISQGGAAYNTTQFLFFNISTFKDGGALFKSLLSSMMSIILFLFLFYHFANILSNFAADLTSSTPLGNMVTNPNRITDKAGNALKSLLKSKPKSKAKDKPDPKPDDEGVKVSPAGADDAKPRTGVTVNPTGKDD